MAPHTVLVENAFAVRLLIAQVYQLGVVVPIDICIIGAIGNSGPNRRGVPFAAGDHQQKK